MNYFFITGTTSGIGKALAELLLQDKENFVFGLSRSNNIDAENFKFHKINLQNPEELENFEFPELDDAESIALVNNAAHKSEIVHLGKRSSRDITEAYDVNIVSPSILMNSFLKQYQKAECKRIILNISSGAGKRPIEAWSTYCASKAAMEMISEVINIEQKIKHPDNPVFVFSVGPGVVDTRMQDEIRKVSRDDFSVVGTFIEYKEKNQLAKPDDIAIKLNEILKNPHKFEKVSFQC